MGKLVILVIVVLFAVNANASWFPGIVHAHSKYAGDDGKVSAERLMINVAGLNLCFLIPTKHYENEKESDRYFSVFDNAPIVKSINQPLVVVPGYEFSIQNKEKNSSKPESGGLLSGKIKIGDILGGTIGKIFDKDKGTSHTLGIGDVHSFTGRKQANEVPALLGQIRQYGMLSVAAHPNSTKLGYWDFTFDKNNTSAVNGVEFFNEDKDDQDKTFKWYLDLLGQGRDVFATSGCDTHDGVLTLDKATLVYVDSNKLTADNLIAAMAKGQTIATQNGVFLTDINHLPGFGWKKVEEIKFSFKILAKEIFKTSKTIRIYCNKLLVDESVAKIPKGEISYEYSWTAKGKYPGANNWIIVVEDCVITSPIRLVSGNATIINPPKNPTDLPIAAQKPEPVYTGGMPILFGKKFNEVTEIMGALPSGTSQNEPSLYFYWQYTYWPKEPYVLSMSYTPYERNDRKAERKVYFQNIYYRGYYSQGNFLRPAQVVPKEILALEPTEYAWRQNPKNELVVIWRYYNRTFAMVVSDSRRQMYDSVKGIDENGRIIYTPKMNQNSRDFRNADRLIYFTAIDHSIDCYTYPKGALERISDPNDAVGRIEGVDNSLETFVNFRKF